MLAIMKTTTNNFTSTTGHWSQARKTTSVVIKQSPCYPANIFLRNMKTILSLDKLEKVKKEMKKYNIDIFDLCETRWEEKG